MDGVPDLFSRGGIIFVKYGVLGKPPHTKHSCLGEVKLHQGCCSRNILLKLLKAHLSCCQVPVLHASTHHPTNPLFGTSENHFPLFAPISTRFQAETKIAIWRVRCTQSLPFAFTVFTA